MIMLSGDLMVSFVYFIVYENLFKKINEKSYSWNIFIC